MDKGYEVLTNHNTLDSCKVFVTESSECFICRDGELRRQEALWHFCDCKSLVAHHSCLLTWIKKGLGAKDRPRCNVCHAEYQLQVHPPWRVVASQWQSWLVLAATATLLGLVPYLVVRMMTAFKSPPPHPMFKAAAVCFGLLSVTLLLKCLAHYCSSRYRQAELSSFSVRARGAEGDEARPGPGRPAAPGHTPAAAAGVDGGKGDPRVP
ncbi:hypothetical protein MATL_G00237780 [Megalops atlanticus]|uniref:RING-CH-type domain-containing protein n=1 Tax=Megalops atlanticus TaxID=7932 RepID=A0A9D3PBP5_MEGAT|nr:hypothetical protein MATL_G00237780 [Megalops atlanticus]